MKLDIKLEMPRLVLTVKNETAVLDAVGATIARRVVQRTQAGQGAAGSLSQPKAGDHPPLRASGALIAGIGYTLVLKAGDAFGTQILGGTAVIAASGRRPDNGDGFTQHKIRLAKERTRKLRAAAIIGALFEHASSGSTSHASLKSKGRGIKVGKIRSRTVVDNASLAAILANPPRDKRARNGGRAVYNVFELNDGDKEAAARAVEQVIKVEIEGR